MPRDEQFPTSVPVSIETRIAGGDISVTSAEVDSARVIVDGPDAAVDAMTIALRGETLIIKQNQEKGLFSLLNASDLRALISRSLSIEVIVPHGSSFDLAAGSADATLSGEFIDVTIKSASGDLRARGEIFGDLDVKSASGDVDVEHVGGDVRMQTASGDLAIGAADGSVSAAAVSGDIKLGSLWAGEVRLQNVSGDIELGIAQGSAVDVDASSTTGDLHSDVPLGDDPEPGAGADQTVVIRARSVSGDLRIRRAPERARLRA